MTGDLCPHGDKDWRCTICCIANLRRDTPRLQKAVRVRDTASMDGPRPGFTSRPPINIAALALLQDLTRLGGPDGIEHTLNTMRDPQIIADIERRTRQYRSRAALILHDALAPYPLTWDTPGVDADGQDIVETKPVPCPVVSEYGDCGGPLMVHRDGDETSDNYGKAAVIVCRLKDDHEWPLAHGGWLRLGVLLGGRMDGVA
jgi:hypothetical protein